MAVFSRYGYHNEDIAWMVSRAIPWTKLDGFERYDDLLEIAETAIDLKWPLTKFSAGKKALSVGAQERLSASILCYLEKDLCKWYSGNFQYLVSFSRQESHNVGFNGLPPGGLMNWRHLLFLMHKCLVKRFSAEYFTTPEEKFHEAVSESYDYIRIHPDEMPIIGCSESVLFGLWRKDLDLFEVCRNLIKYRKYENKKDIEAGKRKLRQMWSYWLGQGTISLMLDEMSHAIRPVYPSDEVAFDAKTDPHKYLPYPVDSPQYRYIKELHWAYGEDFDESFLTSMHAYFQQLREGNSPKKDKNRPEIPEWGDHIESKYLATQYLYFCLTGDLIAPKGGGHNTLLALIFDLLVLFGYRDDLDESEDYLEEMKDKKELRRMKKGLVKNFLTVNQTTGIYKRLK